MTEREHRSDPHAAAPGAAQRVVAALRRNGWRALLLPLYRGLAEWPATRSAYMRLKLTLLLDARVGPEVRWGRVHVTIPGGALEIGRDTRFADDCVLEVPSNPRASLRIGSRCYFAPGTYISAARDIRIGDDVQVGEYTSIRDSMHRFADRDVPVASQGHHFGTVQIGDDVWIGRGCAIIGRPEGLTIGRGAVIGANAVVRTSIPDFAIAVGVPARIIGYR